MRAIGCSRNHRVSGLVQREGNRRLAAIGRAAAGRRMASVLNDKLAALVIEANMCRPTQLISNSVEAIFTLDAERDFAIALGID